ncbi:MAG TPA: DUF6250 domain-containing protein [Ohtaekwangia sp.]|nr:DUF6250 domain-containing protein [Ohtaekwangia sp.]
MKNEILLCILLIILNQCCFAQSEHLQWDKTIDENKQMIYESDFKVPLNKEEWVVEMIPEAGSFVGTEDSALVLDTEGAVTVWFNKFLSGNILIEFKRVVVVRGAKNDRLSDFNQFWMAKDPRNSNLFTRTGPFHQYDSLKLYYVGMGGNGNTTTRFRKYDGNGSKPVINEYRNNPFLLEPNVVYHIKIIVHDGTTSYWVNEKPYFIYTDPSPLEEGYFGFRSIHSHQEITDFKVFRIRD